MQTGQQSLKVRTATILIDFAQHVNLGQPEIGQRHQRQALSRTQGRLGLVVRQVFDVLSQGPELIEP